MARSALATRPASSRILLVEDNPSDAALLGDLLGDHCTHHHVSTQSEAVAALAHGSFDVCLLDLTLPDAAGFSALIDIQEKAPNLPVLILTGLHDVALAKRAVGRGAQDYLFKDELKNGALTRAIDYAIARKQLEKEMFQRANYDALTGLANRTLFESRLGMAQARAERTGSAIAVLFIDLDRFKPINDEHGHDAGDEALKTAAGRMKNVLRAYDTPARLGGDEFAVLLEGIASTQTAAAIAQKILRMLALPFPWQGENLDLSASIGIAFCDAAASPDVLLQQADAAMYHAKRAGGNSYRFYLPDAPGEKRAQQVLQEELREALPDGFRLYYQPCIAADGEAVLGVEALLRWAHPSRGLLCPGEFLATADESGMMPALTQWMLTQLKRDMTLWETAPPLQIAINLCASQLDTPGFLDWFLSLAQASAHRLVIELDDDALSPLPESRLRILASLHSHGVALHLDHFGRAPVSLDALHALPFSLLKLDLSLIKRMGSREGSDAVIRTAIGLAHQLGMKAGAVGVEAAWQMQTLKSQRCDTLQGFLLGRPMTAGHLAEWLKR